MVYYQRQAWLLSWMTEALIDWLIDQKQISSLSQLINPSINRTRQCWMQLQRENQFPQDFTIKFYPNRTPLDGIRIRRFRRGWSCTRRISGTTCRCILIERCGGGNWWRFGLVGVVAQGRGLTHAAGWWSVFIRGTGFWRRKNEGGESDLWVKRKGKLMMKQRAWHETSTKCCESTGWRFLSWYPKLEH